MKRSDVNTGVGVIEGGEKPSAPAILTCNFATRHCEGDESLRDWRFNRYYNDIILAFGKSAKMVFTFTDNFLAYSSIPISLRCS